MTGESRPVPKGPGERVLAGSVDLDGSVEVGVERPASDSTAARIARLLEAARAECGPTERLAEQVATLFLPITLGVAVVTFLVWTGMEGVGKGTLTALSVLVVACPCAFGIATPAATWIALDRAARQGILIGSGAALERLGSLHRLYLDKTGTLTTGTLRLVRTVLASLCPLTEREVKERVAALQRFTPHPLAAAMQEAVGSVPPLSFTGVRYYAGLGATGWLHDAATAWCWLGADAFWSHRALPWRRPWKRLLPQLQPRGERQCWWDGTGAYKRR